MVDINLTNTTGESYCSTNSRFDHLFGCFEARVGSVLGIQPNRRLLEQDRISGPYQHIRTPNSLLCAQVLSCKSDKQGHLPQNAQYHGSFVLEQHGRHSLPQLLYLALEIWGWCEKRNLFLLAQRIPGKKKVEADTESRVKRDLNDWMLHRKVIAPLIRHCAVDLFASRLSDQLGKYVSWRPDPNAFHNDAFTLDWSSLTPYAFPPFSLIPTVLHKTKRERATLVLVAPIWKAQPDDRTYCGLPDISGEKSQIAAGCDRTRSDTPSAPLVEVTRMENIRRRYETMGVSEKAVELLCKSVKSSTTKTDNASCAQWSRWCSERQSDPVSGQCLTF